MKQGVTRKKQFIESASGSPLLRTKLHIPSVRTDLVPRPRLVHCLNESVKGKMTVILAPAGFGKTTLLADWIPQSNHPVGWYSLDEDDNDAARFLHYFIAAVQTLDVRLGESAHGLFQSSQSPSLKPVMTGLINEMASFPDTFVMVLDDYHVINRSAIHDGLEFLIEHRPPQLHLIITSRADPPMPLARWRARSELMELRAADLRFDAVEAATFLNEKMGLGLSAEDVAILEARTEGWITGLQLAALSLQGHEDASSFVRAFAGDDRFVLDYLMEEVLHRQPEGVQRFLLQTSILNRLTGPLCDFVRDQSDSQEMLERLEKANLFIDPLDNSRQWYRYHQLFVDLLRHRLQQVQAEQVSELHRRASQWYERHNMIEEAISHALTSQDWECATRLIDRMAQPMWSSPSATQSHEATNGSLPWWYRTNPLSERELEVLALVATGLSNREMANRLYLSVSTVKRHMSNIYLKLDVHSRTHAVARARQFGLIT